MAKKTTLRDYENTIVYPQTVADQVIFDDGTTLVGQLGTKGNTQTVTYTNLSVATSAWATNNNTQATSTEREDYPYMATFTISGVTINDIPNVVFGYDEQVSQNFAPVSYSTANGVIIEAKEAPTETITPSYIQITKVL